jgi:hypothetical protein
MLNAINVGLTHFSTWLAATPLSGFVAGAAWVVPAVQTIHILAVALVIGAAALINLRALDLVDRREPFVAVLDRFLPAIGWAIPVLLVTGLILIAGEPTRAIFRTIFWIKMALLLIAATVTFSLRGQALTPTTGAAPPVIALKAKAALSIALWIGVVFAGRWIGYAIGWPGSPQ